MVFIVGDVGYIGAYMGKMLINSSYKVVTLENLSRGHRDAIAGQGDFVFGDLADRAELNRLFTGYKTVRKNSS